MNNDQLGAAADKAAGSAKSALGNATGDTKLQAEGAFDKASAAVRDAVGDAKEAASGVADSISSKASELDDKARRVIDDKAGPLLDQVSHKAAEYGREARDAVAGGVATASRVVHGYPVAVLGLVAVVAFLVGRVTAPEPKAWYRRDWH